MSRLDGRAPDQLREVTINVGPQKFAEGSALIETGLTRVLCAVSVEEKVPPFLRGTGRGWITAEYAMLPRSTLTRTSRERVIRGRSHEIQRLIGRSLRSVIDLEALGERTLTVDCDVLQADGGTRTAAVTGSYVALCQAIQTLQDRKILQGSPIKVAVAATSVCLLDGAAILDPCYEEDFKADADFNLVMTEETEFIEVQGTGEEATFSKQQLEEVLALAQRGVQELIGVQKAAITRF